MNQSPINSQVDILGLTFETLKKVRAYLKRMIDAGGSDLHVKANSVIRARINLSLIHISEPTRPY